MAVNVDGFYAAPVYDDLAPFRGGLRVGWTEKIATGEQDSGGRAGRFLDELPPSKHVRLLCYGLVDGLRARHRVGWTKRSSDSHRRGCC